MKHSVLAIAALGGLALATPVQKRQDIDFAAYNAVPISPDVAAPVGDAPPAESTYVASAAADAAASAATTVSGDDTSIGSGAAAVVSKRNAASLAKRAGTCQPVSTAGTGPAVTFPADNALSFQLYPPFSLAAVFAPQVPGYARVVTNAWGAAESPTYMTYQMLNSYDPVACAAYCQAHEGCNSFNIYYERDPSLQVDDTNCPNPPSLTYIKCAIFGGVLTTKSATNVGQWQGAKFHVVIAGSDIWVKTAPNPINGFQLPTNLNNAAINAPSGYMGVQTFPSTQPYDPSVCAKACKEKSAYDIEHGLPSASNPDVCNFFVAYILYKNGDNGIFTCTYYTSSWDKTYATNTGQYDGSGNHYTIGNSWSYAINGAPVNGVSSTTPVP